ncbi:TerB family tellurite resistance protein [Streptomyces samsunensis]|uniref:TerB family tellurite resistance protein n=1 Tax=Streptomyces malaysiensis TaxID=92644 RepID=A0ABX6WK83_STRMQ|nr:TerB family tellurite resistance protein [Streptomyces sp. SID8382]NUH39351.1 TerB family tellurite resistance protein [Streptomyces samsunensis]QPI61762.1 TerB family tellurite resistance protein [Streptomyces solisilvae]
MCVVGVRTLWRTVGDGEFFCPECGGDRNYRRRTGRRRIVVLGLPVLPRGPVAPIVECAACGGRYGTDMLDHPTTTRFSAMLRDAVHTVALAVLAAGGTEATAVRQVAVGAVRAAGFADCSEDQLLALIEALAADTGRLPGACGERDGLDPCGTALAIELHEALEPLAPHLAPTGREAILLQGARIAVADGPYRPAERAVLETVGRALMIGPDDTARLLAATRAAF